MDLQKYRWMNRVCLAFAPTAKDPGYREFHREWHAQITEIKDRDLVLIEIIAGNEIRVNDTVISESSSSQVRKRFHIDSNRFMVILIGKDGSEKFRGDKVTVNQLFQLIDTMPMRQEEMKGKSDSQ